jgi:hypothetical protein
MDWILEHIKYVIVVAAVIASFVSKARRARSEDGPSVDASRPSAQGNSGEGNELERTKRIQEEIRRKIAERRASQRGEGGPPVFTPPPMVNSIPPARRGHASFPRAEPPLPPAPEERSPAPSFNRAAEQERERQQQLAEQLRLLELRRAQIQRETAEAAALANLGDAAKAAASSKIREDLRNPGDLRRLVLLREVLGTPVGLR